MRAKGQADAISMVFRAIHEGKPDQRLLAYQYLQTLPEIAKGDANKVWIVPSEMNKVLENLGGLFSAPKDQTHTDQNGSTPTA
jgi:regulator of protease activity HflC (stomatin/prohibitin superfamily)